MKKILILVLNVVWLCSNDSIDLPVGFSSSFEQIITNPKHKVIRYKGNVKFVYPSIMRWDYKEPTQKEVCSDGENVTVVDHDLEQVSIYYLNKKFDVAKILSKAKHYKDNIYIAKYQDKDYTIALDKLGRIQSMAYYDDMDNMVQIVFKKIRYKKRPFKSNTMKCKFPKDYDIIRG
jgi:outer membrane lipoprotein carrier protein